MPQSPAVHLVPVTQLEALRADPRVLDVVLEPPARRSPIAQPPAPEDVYYKQLPLGQGHRFKVSAFANTDRIVKEDSLSVSGKKIHLTRDGGAFWILTPDNPELLVKLIDGCAFNGYFWLFATGLTDLAMVVSFTDFLSETHRTIRTNDGEPFPPVFDIEAFPCLGVE